jgi:hypothetical protein
MWVLDVNETKNLSVRSVTMAAAKTAKKAAKKSAKKASRPRVMAADLQATILKFMKAGKEYTSREIVEGLGRTPGSAEGGPVVRNLHAMVEAKTVKAVSAEDKRGQVWVKK